MKKLLLLCLFAPLASAQVTPNISLNIPPHGTLNWDVLMNANSVILDNLLGGVTSLPNGLKVTGGIQATGAIVGNVTGNLTGNASGISSNITESQVTGLVTDLASKVSTATTVNLHALSTNIVISASDLTTGTLPHAQLPPLIAGDIPNIAESQVTNLVTDLGAKVPVTTTVNGHALSAPVVVSASDLSTGTLPHAQLPPLVSGDIPNNAANTSGTAGGLSGSPNIVVTSCTGCGVSAIANIQITTGVTPIAGNTCTTNTAAAMTGVAVTSAIIPPTPTSDTSGVTGWGASPALSFTYYVTLNTFNWKVCNTTVGSITPGGSVTWNVGAR